MAFAPDYATSGLFYVYYTRSRGRGDPDRRVPPRRDEPGHRRSEHAVRHVITVPHPGPGESQRRPAPVRPGRHALHRAPATAAAAAIPFHAALEPAGPARQDPAHRSAPDRTRSPTPCRRTTRSSASRRRPARDLVVRPPEPVALLVRPRHAATSTSATSARTPGRRSTTGRSTSAGDEASTSAGAASRDGTSTAPATRTATRPTPDIVPPVFEYSHSGAATAARSRAATSSATRRCQSLLGRYVYSDYCNGDIYSNVLAIPDAQGDAHDGPRSSTSRRSFGEDSCGHVYVAGQGSGTNVFRIRQTDPPGQFCIPQYDLPVLTAHVEDDFTIDLKDPNGQDAERRDAARRARTRSSSTTTRRSTTSI